MYRAGPLGALVGSAAPHICTRHVTGLGSVLASRPSARAKATAGRDTGDGPNEKANVDGRDMRRVREMQRAVCRNETLATSPQLEKDLNCCSPRCCRFARTLKFDFYVSGSLTLKAKKTPHCFGPHCFATVLLVFYQF